MKSNIDNPQVAEKIQKPNPDLDHLKRRVGTWKMSGALQGQSLFEPVAGGYFYINHFDFLQDGRRSKGVEIFGHEKEIGAEPGSQIKSRIYGFLDGITQDYVYEPNGDAFTIWLGEKGSANVCHARFQDDDDSMIFEWKYPGGEYQVIFTRLK